jgi:hypothetical protein
VKRAARPRTKRCYKWVNFWISGAQKSLQVLTHFFGPVLSAKGTTSGHLIVPPTHTPSSSTMAATMNAAAVNVSIRAPHAARQLRRTAGRSAARVARVGTNAIPFCQITIYTTSASEEEGKKSPLFSHPRRDTDGALLVRVRNHAHKHTPLYPPDWLYKCMYYTA